MEITGIIQEITKLPVITKKNGGTMQFYLIVLKTEEQYNPYRAIKCNYEKMMQFIDSVSVGMTVKISVNYYSNKYKENWYNQCDGWRGESVMPF
jgi:hypothetical protein